MRKLQKKSKISTIALILVLTIATFVTFLPAVNAADVPTWSYITAIPDCVGVGQTTFITMWLDKVPPTAQGASGDRWTFSVEVTKPDESKETLGPLTSDPVGSAWIQYTPTNVGTYTFQMSFPGQTLTGIPDMEDHPSVGDYYKASDSPKVELTVQQDAIPEWPANPLPGSNDYWDRPIEAQNRDWWQISGNWLGGGMPTGNFNRYTKAPNSAHIVWTRPITFGGIAGGQYGNIPYYDGLSYQSKFPSPVIIQGRLYYAEYPNIRYPPIDNYPQAIYCVDLRTGETLWQKDLGSAFSASGAPGLFGQIYDYESPNAHGTLAYLWAVNGSTWFMYDPFNGNHLTTMTNVPSGTTVTAKDGSILRYVLNGDNGWLAMWNSSKAIWSYWLPYGSNRYWNWRPPLGQTVDALKGGYSWNITIPKVPGRIYSVLEDRIIGASGVQSGFGAYGTNAYTIWALSLKPETRGQLLWKKDFTAPPILNTSVQMGPMDLESGVFTISIKETMQWYGFDLNTGNQLWGPTEPHSSWDMYGMRGSIAYGKLYSCGMGGILYCYDVKTGELLWTYETGSSGFEVPYGHWPLSIGAIADGKIYLYSSEHSPTKPFWRGSSLRCVDAETGDELSKISTWANTPIIADGYLVTLNSYDNQIYCFGKGKITTIVTGPESVQPLGTPVLLTGTVMDQSPGAKDTPAISDEDMSEWMEYLYMQKPMPMGAKGVEVKLEALDPNMNFYEIGTVTSDASGFYSHMWTPEVPGKYTIIATFEGSESYFSSYAETAIGVTEAPSPGQPIEPEPTEAPLITTEVAIIAVAIIAVVGIVAFWALRKRK